MKCACLATDLRVCLVHALRWRAEPPLPLQMSSKPLWIEKNVWKLEQVHVLAWRTIPGRWPIHLLGCDSALEMNLQARGLELKARRMNRLIQLIQDNHGTHRGWVRLLLAQASFVLGHLNPWTQIRVPVVKRLVFVCLGNINRSAFADVLAQGLGARTASFGLATTTHSPAYEMAISTAPLFGVSLDAHRTTDEADFEYQDGDLLAVMEMRHVRRLLAKGYPAEAIVLLGHWSAPRRLHIHDPHTLSARYFVTCFAILESAVRSLVQELRDNDHPAVRE